MKIPPMPARPKARDTAGDPATAAPAALHEFGGFTPASRWATEELRRLAALWLSHESGARGGEHPGDLHQLRVATRRIDATLSLFRSELPEQLRRKRHRAKVLCRALGAVRDLDVQLLALQQQSGDLTEAERSGLAPLRLELEKQRAVARTAMLRELEAHSTRQWIETLAHADSGETSATGTHSAVAVLPEQVRRRYRKLRNAVRSLDKKSTMREYHQVRRQAKQLRYAIECGAALFGGPAEEVLKALRRLQDESGVHQDAYLAHSRLTALAADPQGPLPPATLFLMGRLAERHARGMRRVGRTVERSWRRLRGKRWKALRERLSQLLAAEALIAGTAQPPAPPQPSATPPEAADHAGSPQTLTH